MTLLELHNEIEKDIKKGVFTNFPKVRQRLIQIKKRLLDLSQNKDAEKLSTSDWIYLKEQGYEVRIPKFSKKSK